MQMTLDQQTIWIKAVENGIADLKTFALPLFALLVLGSCFVMVFTLRWIKLRGLKSADALNLAVAKRPSRLEKR